MAYLCEQPIVGAEKPKKVVLMTWIWLGEHNTNWFHYGCVGFNPDVDTDYYCSDDCRKNQKKRKTR